MRTDVIGKPVVQLLLSRCERLKGRTGHQSAEIHQYICTSLASIPQGRQQKKEAKGLDAIGNLTVFSAGPRHSQAHSDAAACSANQGQL